MEPDQEDKSEQNVSSTTTSPVTYEQDQQSPPSTITSTSPHPATTDDNIIKVQAEDEKRPMDHERNDSLVTVRLSEPPQPLVVDTNVMPSSKSFFGTEYTPADAMAETLREEEDTRSKRDSMASEASGGFARNLQSELEAGNEEMADQDAQSSDEEEVDWEQLQETEEKESKDQDSDMVSLPDGLFLTFA